MFFLIRPNKEGTEYEERHTPPKMKHDDLGRFLSWYMQLYHTEHMEHIRPDEDLDVTDLSER